MSTGELVVIAVRLAIPLLILRYALIGGLAAVAADTLDVVLIEVIGLGGFGAHYAELDKLLDSYYLTIEAWVAFGWASPYARVTALALYVYRMVGVVLFEVTGVRVLLLIFPNQFENWWLYCVATERLFPALYPRSQRTAAIPFVLLLIPKVAQEYLLHFEEVRPWDWIKRNVLGTD